MGQLVFILGRSGTGKSFSMRNMDKDSYMVINVQGKILPFKGAGKVTMINCDDSDDIVTYIKSYSKQFKIIIVDDFQYVMANEFMRRAMERGYDKFTEIARHAWDIANCVRSLPQDVIVYIMCHTDTDSEGLERLKTIGKLLDEKIVLEGMSTIVLKTNVSDGKYVFLTQNNGKDTTKSPAGMFPSYAIDNDLKYVDDKIRSYYEFEGAKSEEEMAKEDAAVKQEDIIKEEKKSRRGRKKKEEIIEETFEKEEETEEKPKRGRKKKSVTEELEDEREIIQQENEEIIANSNLSDEGEIAFEDAEMPKLKDLPKRKSRNKVAEVDTGTGAIVGDDQPVTETSEEVEDKPTVRRRRRRTN
jgi:hypothetical protein